MARTPRLGATGSSVNDMGNMGALTPILGQLAGGTKRGQMAIDFAQQLYPEVEKPDPYEAALQYFLEMGRQASQPGATVLGSAVGAMQAPADYLAAKKKEKRETDRARMQTALQLAPNLKPPTVTKAGYINVMVDGVPQVMTPAEIQAEKAAGKVVAPYEKSSTTQATYKNVTIDDVPTMATDAEIAAAKAAGKKVTPYQAPPQGSEDRTRMDVIDLTKTDDANTPIDERITSITRSEFDPSKHSPLSARPDQTQTDRTRMDVIDLNKTDDPNTDVDDRITSILRSEFDPAKHAPLSAQPPSETEQADPLIDVLDTSIEDNPTTPRNEQRKTIKRSEFDAAKHVQLSAIPDEDLGAKDRLQAERDFRTEYTKRTESLTEAKRNFQVINSSMEADSAAGDIALVTSFMKMLDPGSVVRETEFANARDTAGLLQKLENLLVEKPQTGKFLTPDQRKNFVDLAQQYLYAAQNQNTRVRQSLGTSVSQYNLNPVAIFGYEVAPPAAHLNPELVKVAIKNNTTVDALWAVMSDDEKEQYGG